MVIINALSRAIGRLIVQGRPASFSTPSSTRSPPGVAAQVVSRSPLINDWSTALRCRGDEL